MINIAFAFDARVIDGTAALIASIANACVPRQVTLHGLYPELEGTTAERILAFCRSLEIEMHADPFRDDLIESLPDHPTLPRATFRRLFHPAILKERCDSYLYLDTDVLVIKDPTPILDSPQFFSTVSAVRDVGVPTLKDGLSYMPQSVEFGSSAAYFNCGVMGINLARWNDNNCTERVIEFASTHSRQLRFGDQDAINFVLRGDIDELESHWNMQVGPLDYQRRLDRRPRPSRAELARRAKDAGILHFAGGGKPWAKKWYVLHRGLYYGLLAKSGWKSRRQANLERVRNKLSGGIAGIRNFFPLRQS